MTALSIAEADEWTVTEPQIVAVPQMVTEPQIGVVRQRAARPAPAGPVRLTRRGRVVLAGLAVTVAAVAVFLVSLSLAGGALASGHGPARAGYQGMRQVVVEPGQTLWSIATAAEPTADPRTVIPQIMAANSLGGSTVYAGEVLWVPGH